MGSGKREVLLDTAIRLFEANGYHATGVDRILEEAGVAKMTLYKHFGSKEELIVAALKRRSEKLQDWLWKEASERGGTPVETILSLFDVLNDWFRSPDFHGCMFIAAESEYEQPNHPIHMACNEHKQRLLTRLTEVAQQAELQQPQQIARQIFLLMQGATVAAHATGEAAFAEDGRKAAETLISAART